MYNKTHKNKERKRIKERMTMKKFFTVFLSAILSFCMLFAFSGCKEKPYGKFYTLWQAHKAGYITQEDLINIAYYKHPNLEENAHFYGEDFSPIPLAEFSEDLQRKIKLDKVFYENQIAKEKHWRYYMTVEDVYIVGYYGVYNGCVALLFGDIGQAVVRMDSVFGVKFYYGSSVQIKIWREN